MVMAFIDFLVKNSDLLEKISEKFQTVGNKSPTTDETEVISDGDSKITYHSYPFNHIIIENVLSDEMLMELESDYARIPLDVKYNDLYHFKQSIDLISYADSEIMIKTQKYIIDPLKTIISRISGIEFSEKNYTFFSKYEYSDHLLCHDDQTEDRAIAFIYYMTTDDWNDDDGGHLELYDRYIMGYAKNVVKRYIPKRNTIALFQVSKQSFHSVAEVLNPFNQRKSLTGWFTHKNKIELVSSLTPPSFNNYDIYRSINNDNEPKDIMIELVNSQYLKDEIVLNLREIIFEEYQVMLTQFLKPQAYKQLLNELQCSLTDTSVGSMWKLRNFPQICRINVMNNEFDEKKYPTVSKIKKLLKSVVFSYFVSNISGINMFTNEECIPQSKSNTPHNNQIEDFIDINLLGDLNVKASFEIHHYSHGCYTLSNDFIAMLESNDNFLDVFYIVMDDNKMWHDSCGGTINYEPMADVDIDIQAREITPKCNSLVVSFKHSEETSFVKYINCRVKDGYSSSEYFLFYSRYNLEDRTFENIEEIDNDLSDEVDILSSDEAISSDNDTNIHFNDKSDDDDLDGDITASDNSSH